MDFFFAGPSSSWLSDDGSGRVGTSGLKDEEVHPLGVEVQLLMTNICGARPPAAPIVLEAAGAVDVWAA